MANPAASTIIDLARSLIRAEAGSDVPAVSDTIMLQAITDADKEIYRAFRKSNGNTPVDIALESGNVLAAETAINDADGIAITDVIITVDSTAGYDPSGGAIIWKGDMFDIFFYTGVTPTTFTGVTGLAFAHADNEAIQPLYALASNFRNFRRSDEYGDGVQVNSDPSYAMEGPPASGHFSTRDNGTTKYLWLPRGSTGTCSYIFDKISNTINSTDDVVSFDDDWLFYYAWRAIELSLFGRGDYPIISYAKTKGDAAKLDNLKDRNTGRRVRIRPLAIFNDSRAAQISFRENAL